MARLAFALLERGQNVVICAHSQAALNEIRALLVLFNPDKSFSDPSPLRLAWEDPFVVLPQYASAMGGRAAWAERMAALYSLRRKSGNFGVLTGLDNFLLRLPPPDIFAVNELELQKGMDMAPELILDQAVDWGYVRAPVVNAPGEIASRGDILDIFCPGCQRPLRLEFIGDTLEDMRLFDPVSQRSVADVQEMSMIPVSPVPAGREGREKAEAFWTEEVRGKRLDAADLPGLRRAADSGGRDIFPGMFYARSSKLEDWLPSDCVYILPGEAEYLSVLKEVESRWTETLERESGLKGFTQPPALVLRPWTEVKDLLAGKRRVCFETLPTGLPEAGEILSLREKNFSAYQELFPKKEAQERPWQHLVLLMRDWTLAAGAGRDRAQAHSPGTGETTDLLDADDALVPETADFPRAGAGGRLILSFSSERARTRFLKLAVQEGFNPHLRLDAAESGLFALISPFRKGLYLPADNFLALGEDVLQPRVERGRALAKSAFQGLNNYDSLEEGDFLVHRDYGVGIFRGLCRMALGGAENDYLLLQYSGEDRLYLPVDRLSLIQRFKSSDGASPAPDRLGGVAWAAGKEKVRRAVERIAADLVQMYALRKVVKGFSYAPVDEMYREFEAGFGFEETPDQARAIEDVLGDMEKPEPMDRLVCGDVGFGKTEVALRAAFRAAMNGRQTAFLCPTTILAEQHYQTFRARLAAFPVNIGLLSRFVSPLKQKEVIKATAQGRIDILIGTHRLLSGDVVIPNLGLLILDEEQRFGVRHKERLKELRKNVDALTLTATPIPRTLQLSLSGIRELSVIETPPLERKPVATALIERDEGLLRSILERELERQGQVFWVHNRVQGLEGVAEYVKKLAPQARVGLAHGQMAEKALEENMRRFWRGELDILVCTAIIESGLDFPRANTLVVDHAHMFGLGQLYQLRGRVGRSERQAFAVFVAPDLDNLPEMARKRLGIILDMDYLGAGFQVAMEDLRLRGAGNILGESQSGHINRVGLDLFLEMLEQAVAELKGAPAQNRLETELTLGVPAFIPESYMREAKDRMRYYKILSSVQEEAAMRDAVLEISDRFGRLPQELENFVAVLNFKRYLGKHEVNKADIFPDRLRLTFAGDARLDPARLVAFVLDARAKNARMRLVPPGTLELSLEGETLALSLDKACSILYPLWNEGADNS
ncbi:MAG: transcription-repair coupling factor [Desulfovibrio sp.]|jgi:transcription-repair coupling factor (superfamily II helicase)|nr:transcription-repair coupling factor [Desulfovibrio sp.]